MKAQSKQFPPSKSHRRFVWTALLLVLSLLSHSLDNCPAHLGLPFAPLIRVQQIKAPGLDTSTGSHHTAKPIKRFRSDGCDSVTEMAVLTSSPHLDERHAVTLSMIAIMPLMLPRIALANSLLLRAGPPAGPFLTSAPRFSRPNRAPPVSS